MTKDSGWSSPTAILTILSLLMASVGSYLAIQRNDSKEVKTELKDHFRRLIVLETVQNIMWEEREREAERDRRRRPDG